MWHGNQGKNWNAKEHSPTTWNMYLSKTNTKTATDSSNAMCAQNYCMGLKHEMDNVGRTSSLKKKTKRSSDTVKANINSKDKVL